MGADVGVVVVDATDAGRTWLHDLLTAVPIAVLGMAGYGAEARALVEERHPACVVIGVGQPPAAALGTIASLSAAFPELPIVACCPAGERLLVRRALLAGAADCLLQPIDAGSLGAAIGAAVARARWRGRGHAGAPAPGGTVVTVLGAAPGVGATTVALNLAAGIARQIGARVALMQLAGSANPAGHAVWSAEAAPDQGEASGRGDAGGRLPLPLRRLCGVDLFSGADLGTAAMVAPDDVEGAVGRLSHGYPVVVLDARCAFAERVAAAVEMAAVVLLVGGTVPTAVDATAVALTILRSWSIPRERVRLVLNRVGVRGGISKRAIERALGCPVDYRVPDDPAVGRGDSGAGPLRVVDPTSRAGRALARLARSLHAANLSTRLPRSGAR